jgi:hypothetical protein
MDSKLFEYITSSLSTSKSRRLVFTVLATGILGGLPQLPWTPQGAAACKKVGKPCEKNRDCCGGEVCRNGKCKCNGKKGFKDCDGDGSCESLLGDRANCGECGVACDAGEICADGICEDCPTPTIVCGNVCCISVLCDNGVCGIGGDG